MLGSLFLFPGVARAWTGFSAVWIEAETKTNECAVPAHCAVDELFDSVTRLPTSAFEFSPTTSSTVSFYFSSAMIDYCQSFGSSAFPVFLEGLIDIGGGTNLIPVTVNGESLAEIPIWDIYTPSSQFYFVEGSLVPSVGETAPSSFIFSAQCYLPDTGYVGNALRSLKFSSVYPTEQEESEMMVEALETMPALSWGFSTTTGNGTATNTYSGFLDRRLGSATSSFPMCVMYQPISLLDVLVQVMNGDASPQILTLSSTWGETTYELPLYFGSEILHLETVTGVFGQLSDYTLWMAWMLFGYFILWDLFLKYRQQEDAECN